MRKAKVAKRVRIEVTPVRRPKRTRPVAWCVKSHGERENYFTKQVAVRCAVEEAKAIVAEGGKATVRIHDRKGKFQEERTYPRSSDPFPPKG